jgi:hypothetical protein
MISLSPASIGFGVMLSATARPALFSPSVTAWVAPEIWLAAFSINVLLMRFPLKGF